MSDAQPCSSSEFFFLILRSTLRKASCLFDILRSITKNIIVLNAPLDLIITL